MANTLLDTIKQNLQAPSSGTPNAAPLGINQTAQTQQLLQAKSGRAVADTGQPRISNIGEQLANRQAQLGQQQLQQQGQTAAANVQQEEEYRQAQESTQTAALDEQSLEQMDQYTRQNEAILDEYSQGQRQLDLNKDKAKLEQVGFMARLSNQQYIDNLQREGARARLDNDTNFRENLARSVFDDEQDMFKDDLTFRSMINADNRSFADQLQNIDVDYALKMAEAENQAANQRMMWTGVGNVTSGGIQAYASNAGQQQGGE
jgi:hypothetical protein